MGRIARQLSADLDFIDVNPLAVVCTRIMVGVVGSRNSSDVAVENAIRATAFCRCLFQSSVVTNSSVAIVVRNMVKVVVEAFRAQAQPEEVPFAVLDFGFIVLIAEEVGVNTEVGSRGVVEGG